MQEPDSVRWARKQHALRAGSLASRMIPCGSVVLPDSAAPCLSFDDAENPKPIFEVFGAPFVWSSADRERLSAYLVIGSDGSGSPICLERATGRILLLDHDDDFRTVQFVNSNLTCLAECLLAYMGETSTNEFFIAVRGIDPPAAAVGAFWAEEAAMLNDA